MAEGISTLISGPDAFDGRMALVTKDARALIQSGPVLVTVATYHAKGSRDQSALFHKLCDHISEFWNSRHPDQRTSPARVKTDLKTAYGVIVTEYSPVNDTRRPRLASWAEYTKAQRHSLISATLAWMFDNGIPDLPEIPAAEYARYREAAA